MGGTLGNGSRKKEEGICDTRRARWKEEQKERARWQAQGLTRQQSTREEGQRPEESAYKIECNHRHHISHDTPTHGYKTECNRRHQIRHDTPTHGYWTHKRRKKEKTLNKGVLKEREEVVSEEWVAMTNGMDMVKYAGTQLPQGRKYLRM